GARAPASVAGSVPRESRVHGVAPNHRRIRRPIAQRGSEHHSGPYWFRSPPLVLYDTAYPSAFPGDTHYVIYAHFTRRIPLGATVIELNGYDEPALVSGPLAV